MSYYAKLRGVLPRERILSLTGSRWVLPVATGLLLAVWLCSANAAAEAWQYYERTSDFDELRYFAGVRANGGAGLYIRQSAEAISPEIYYLNGDGHICGSGLNYRTVTVTWRIDEGQVFTGGWSLSDDREAMFYREGHMEGAARYFSASGNKTVIHKEQFMAMLRKGNVLSIRTVDGCGQQTLRKISLEGAKLAIDKLAQKTGLDVPEDPSLGPPPISNDLMDILRNVEKRKNKLADQ